LDGAVGAKSVLNERRANGLHYDAATDVTRVLVSVPEGTVRTRTVAAHLLLDAQGFLVGVDLEPGSVNRAGVMVGPHERVAKTAPSRVGLCGDASGTVFEVRLANARASIRGNEKNPYT
jgi:hypothetical protein